MSELWVNVLNRKPDEMEMNTAVIAYEAPRADLGATRLAMAQGVVFAFIVTILALLIIGGLAAYCIYKGMDLNAGWNNGDGTWTIQCVTH